MKIVEIYTKGWIREGHDNITPDLRLSAPPFDFIYNKITQYSRIYAIDISYDDWEEAFNNNRMLDMSILLKKLGLNTNNIHNYRCFNSYKLAIDFGDRNNWIFIKHQKRMYICDLSSEIPFKPTKKYIEQESAYRKKVARNTIFNSFIAQPNDNRLTINGYVDLILSKDTYNPANPGTVEVKLTQRGIELIHDLIINSFNELLNEHGLAFKATKRDISKYIIDRLSELFLFGGFNTDNIIIKEVESTEQQ